MVGGARGQKGWGAEERNPCVNELGRGRGILFIGSKAGEACGRGRETAGGGFSIQPLRS
jgi:hypothetical protein